MDNALLFLSPQSFVLIARHHTIFKRHCKNKCVRQETGITLSTCHFYLHVPGMDTFRIRVHDIRLIGHIYKMCSRRGHVSGKADYKAPH